MGWQWSHHFQPADVCGRGLWKTNKLIIYSIITAVLSGSGREWSAVAPGPPDWGQSHKRNITTVSHPSRQERRIVCPLIPSYINEILLLLLLFIRQPDPWQDTQCCIILSVHLKVTLDRTDSATVSVENGRKASPANKAAIGKLSIPYREFYQPVDGKLDTLSFDESVWTGVREGV